MGEKDIQTGHSGPVDPTVVIAVSINPEPIKGGDDKGSDVLRGLNGEHYRVIRLLSSLEDPEAVGKPVLAIQTYVEGRVFRLFIEV